MDESTILEILGIIFNIVLIIPVIYLIWDHFKDDRILTKQVQDLYYSVEYLIFLYYFERLFNGYFKDEFWQEHRAEIFPEFKFESINGKFEHRKKYIREKVRVNFNEHAKYLGMICIKNEENSSEYLSNTHIILTYEGELRYFDNQPLVTNYKEMTQENHGWNIRNYLGSLRDYWTKNYKKRLIRPKLKVKHNIRKMVHFFHEILSEQLETLKLDYLGLEPKPAKKKVEFSKNYVLKYLKHYDDMLKGLVREGLQIKGFSGKYWQFSDKESGRIHSI